MTSWSSSSSSSNAVEETTVTRTIVLTPSQTNVTVDGKDGYQLVVAASDAVGLSNEIFRYYTQPDGTAKYTGVCSWCDLEQWPVGVSRESDLPAAFRTASLDIFLRSQAQCEELWNSILTDVRRLLYTLEAGDDIVAGTAITISNQ